MPLSLGARPVVWGYDHALRLYPAPDALVLADSAPGAYSWGYEVGGGGTGRACARNRPPRRRDHRREPPGWPTPLPATEQHRDDHHRPRSTTAHLAPLCTPRRDRAPPAA